MDNFKQSLEANKVLVSLFDTKPEKKRHYKIETDKHNIDRIQFFNDDVQWLELPLCYGLTDDIELLYNRLKQVTQLTLCPFKNRPCYFYSYCWGDCKNYDNSWEWCHQCMSNADPCECVK